MPNVWGLHMPMDIGPNAIDNSKISISWDLLGDFTDLPNDKEVIKQALATAYPDKKKGAIPVEAGIIRRFVHELSEGDIVAYPSKHDRMVNIGKVAGPTFFEPGGDIEDWQPNSRTVKWLGHFPRSDFTQSALNELGAYITLFSIRNHASEFLAKIDSKFQTEPSEEADENNDDDIVSINVTRQAEETAEDFVIRRIHNGLTGHEFEHFVAHLLTCMGYTTRVTQKSSDGGVDVIAHNDKLGFEPPIIKVQCKRTTRQINETDVRELLGTLVEGEYGLFVTLGAFANKVRQSERNLSKLRLIDGDQLFEIITQNYSKFSPRYRNLIPLKQIYVPDLG